MSSARAVRCFLKWKNERNPRHLLPPALFTEPRTLMGLPALSGRKAGTTSNPHGPYVLGYTRVTMPTTEGGEAERWSKSYKSRPSSDWRLQLVSMKLELLVMAYQLRRREYVPGPCTHRPSSAESGGHPKICQQIHGEFHDWR